MLRTGLALSAITSKPLTITNIRANRPKPGLANQHLAGLKAILIISGAKVEGAEIGSTTVRFFPGDIKHGEYEFAVGTAGSVTLVLQTIMPALASVPGKSRIVVSGGTDVKWSPPVDYYRLVLFPMLKKMGADCSLEIRERGYFPKGGGIVEFVIRSSGSLSKFVPCPGNDITDIRGTINITGLPVQIAKRIEKSIIDELPSQYSDMLKINLEHREMGPSQGVGVVLAAMRGTVVGAASLGERGKPAEKVGKEAAVSLISELETGADVDVHMADQLLPFMALAPSGSHFTASRLSEHAMTNIRIIEQFLGKTFEISGTTIRRI